MQRGSHGWMRDHRFPPQGSERRGQTAEGSMMHAVGEERGPEGRPKPCRPVRAVVPQCEPRCASTGSVFADDPASVWLSESLRRGAGVNGCPTGRPARSRSGLAAQKKEGGHESKTSAGAAAACLAIAVISARCAALAAGRGRWAALGRWRRGSASVSVRDRPSDDLPGCSPPFGSDHCLHDRQKGAGL